MNDREDPLLVLDRARILAGGAVGDALTARGGTARVTLVGNARPLFRLLAGDATLESGSALVAGAPCRNAVASGLVGLALGDQKLPPEWTAERYLFESARLIGFEERRARHEADTAIQRFELAETARRRLGNLHVSVKRVILLAHATLGSPRVLAVEAPLAELEPNSRAYVEAALERAASEKCLLASVTGAEAGERALVERADWVVVFANGRVTREGTPDIVLAPGRRYTATVTHSAGAFLAALAEAGARATPADLAPALLGFVPHDRTGITRVLVELGEGASPDEIVQAAHRAGAPLVELISV